MNRLKKLLIIGLVASVASPALAGKRQHGHGQTRDHYVAYAKVIEVLPIYRTVEVVVPQQTCWQEQEQRPVRRQVSNETAEKMLVGGLIGGVIGHHLGQGDSRDVATFAGTLIGAAIGRDQGVSRESPRGYYVVEKQHCRNYADYRTEQQLDGYQVTYRYHGELFQTRMDQRPGDRIRVSVHLAPNDY